jgi:hypothetical protein
MAEEFDPRRAEPDQEFEYTTSVDSTIEADEDVPDGAEVVGIRTVNEGKDNERTVREIRRYGVARTLKADKQGIVHPKTSADVAVLDSFGLPRARVESTAPPKKSEG